MKYPKELLANLLVFNVGRMKLQLRNDTGVIKT